MSRPPSRNVLVLIALAGLCVSLSNALIIRDRDDNHLEETFGPFLASHRFDESLEDKLGELVEEEYDEDELRPSNPLPTTIEPTTISPTTETSTDPSDDDESKPFSGTIWALLVAGSNEYYNYRHQADVCHSYQVLRRHGVPQHQIITMMYDDVANADENPYQGTIINAPGGPDVYKGVVKDYVGEDVTPENFLKVLQGDEHLASQGRRVINSTSNDHVFVYFADHGAPGLVAFPSSELKATDLIKTLKSMHSKKRFAKLVFYMEACESGSMFKGLLPSNLNIFATTAANNSESSYACYYDEERETYLGDVYSVNWLQDSDNRQSLNRETLSSQFKLVKKETNTSHVQEFGDLRIGKLHVSEFQGAKRENENSTCHSHQIKVGANCNLRQNPLKDAVPSHDVPMMIAKKKYQKSLEHAELFTEEEAVKRKNHFFDILHGRDYLVNKTLQLAKSLHALTVMPPNFEEMLIVKRDYAINENAQNEAFENLVWNKNFEDIDDHHCYHRLVEAFDEHCFDLSTHSYALRYLYSFVNLCNLLSEFDGERKSLVVDDMVLEAQRQCNLHSVTQHRFKRIH